MDVQLNKELFNSRLERVLNYWKVRTTWRVFLRQQLISRKSGSKDEDFSSVADCDALLLLAGDPAGEEEPTKKGVAFQVRPPISWRTSITKDLGRLGCLDTSFRRRFSSSRKTDFIFCALPRKVISPHITAFPSSHRLLAKILSQVATPKSPVPVTILVSAKGKEPATDALSKFLHAYTSSGRVGALVKEKHAGKMINEWSAAVEGAATKPTLVDIAPAISGFVAVKDDEEIVRPP
jgi:hypothetical protein